MRRLFIGLWLALKGASVQFASIIPAMVGFHLVGRFVYHSVPTWLPGCASGLAMAAALWLWYCLRSGFPVLWALGTLSISSILWFFFLIAVFRARFIFDHHESVAASDVVVLIISVVVVLYLRHVLIRRNHEAERFSK
jgi:hypothetical protein